MADEVLLMNINRLWLVWAILLTGVSLGVAQEATDEVPTVVFGSAATADGGQNAFMVEQAKDAPNPLGNPIETPERPTQVFDVPSEIDSSAVEQNSEPVSAASSINNQENLPAEAQALGKDFQNTVMEANGRVYDVQSYPEQDLKLMGNSANPQTIYSPNVND